MNKFIISSAILALINSATCLPTEQAQIYRRGFNTFSPGFNSFNGGFNGFNGGFGGWNGFNSFGFPTIIKNNDFNANAKDFHLNEFDRNTKAAVFADNVHKKNIDKDHVNVNKDNSLAVI